MVAKRLILNKTGLIIYSPIEIVFYWKIMSEGNITKEKEMFRAPLFDERERS